jgi:peptidyl-prolyl cis-trans isomerase SDCCAG10
MKEICANINLQNSKNYEKFFITLGNKELNINRAQNIIFGKVVGDTIYNVLKMNDCVTDHNNAPLYPVQISSPLTYLFNYYILTFFDL